jgi:GT2 family glycosyltransferase
VVVDDGSRPEEARASRAAASAHGASYHLIVHAGVAAARNAGWTRARGELVAFIADDYSLPAAYLEQADELFRRYPDAEVVTFNVRSRGPSPARHVQQLYMELVLLSNAAAEPDANGVIRSFRLPASRAAVFRRATLERLGGFDESMRIGEDGEMGQRLAAHGIPVYFAPSVYVDHWEDKTFAQFLGQRLSYGASFYELWSRNHGDEPRPYWTRRAVARHVTSRLRPWFLLSRRRGMAARYLLLLPGLAIFLGRFFWTLHVLERRELEKARS